MPKPFYLANLLVFLLSFSSCSDDEVITHGDLRVIISDQLFTSIEASSIDHAIVSPRPTEYLVLDNGNLENFRFVKKSIASLDGLGGGQVYSFSGINDQLNIGKTLTVSTFDQCPDLAVIQVSYINHSDKDLLIRGWVNHSYQISAAPQDSLVWAFQGSSSNKRADWIKPIRPGYYQENYMGMNDADYGGGVPVTDIWTPQRGIVVGHAALTPKLVSLPTEMKKYSDKVSIGVEKKFPYPSYLRARDTLATLETFVAVHQGDYYNGLKKYAQLMEVKGIEMPSSEPAAYEPIWCAWGYERNFTLDEVIGTLPKVKELGIKWVVLDDGFQQAEGDWHTNEDKFPEGDGQMRELVDEIHEFGLKAKLWWAPLAADPSSKLLQENPEMRLYLKDWAPQYITWWDAYYLSPSHPQTVEHTKEVVDLFINQWGFDGLKLDGQHMNAIQPDYNPKVLLENPEQGPEQLPQFFKLIYNQARDINPHAVIENCPCGTCMSFFNMPYMNQAVSSDPTSSWQIRLKGKAYKALVPNTAYYGDHVELSDEGTDFASSFGVGAVLGTKFTWPKDNPKASNNYLLTKEKEAVWQKWFSVYNQKMLSKALYRGDLYDIAYDKPETHTLQKGDTLHYAFYSDSWNGNVELRGLESKRYLVRDYMNDQIMGEVHGSSNTLSIQFEDFILLEAYPK